MILSTRSVMSLPPRSPLSSILEHEQLEAQLESARRGQRERIHLRMISPRPCRAADPVAAAGSFAADGWPYSVAQFSSAILDSLGTRMGALPASLLGSRTALW